MRGDRCLRDGLFRKRSGWKRARPTSLEYEGYHAGKDSESNPPEPMNAPLGKVILLAWFAGMTAPASAQFGPSITTVNVPSTPSRFAAGDLSGDGKADLVCFSTSPPKVWFYERGAGDSFSVPLEIADPGAVVNEVALWDVDGNGHADVLFGTGSNLWWVSNQGASTFLPAAPLLATASPSVNFALGDLDGDGVVDLVTSGLAADRRVHFGLGGGLFAPFAPLPVPAGQGFDLHIMDLDGDPTMDLLVAYLVEDWLVEFDAVGNPTATQLALQEADFFASGDMDGDGDLDLVRSAYFTGKVGWHENQGGVLGAFVSTPGVIPTFTPPALGDIDGDGDLDIVVAGDVLDQLIWVENLNGNALSGHQIIGSPGGASGLALLDFNGDGTLDVLVNDRNSNTIERFLNRPLIGSTLCSALPNSATSGALLTARGSEDVGDNWVMLELGAAPPHQFTLLITSQTTGNTTPAGSMGVMCLGGPYGRYLGPGEVSTTDANGQRRFSLDLTNTPTMTVPTQVLSGETWHWQAWFRDRNPGPTSNFSDAVSISFL